MDKNTLRNALFEKYFEVTDGILALDLVNSLSFIPKTWKELKELCRKNIKHFTNFDTLEMIKMVTFNQKEYLILKLRINRYVIIDISKMNNITKEQFEREFNEEFFVKRFKERSCPGSFSDWYYTENFDNPKILVDFYNENKDVLSLSSNLYYCIKLDDALTHFSIDFVNASALLGFQTPDQFLYEQLFLEYDLSYSPMQDAQSKIGIDRMYEMSEKIKEIRLPEKVIPKDLLYQFYSNNNNKKLKIGDIH